MNNRIAVVILNNIQFENVKLAIEEFNKKGYQVDIYCQDSDSVIGFKELFDDNVKTLKEQGYKVYRKEQNKKYKILLEPYPSMNIDAKYKIRYHYSTISAKPDIVYGHPEKYIYYDAILCGGKYDANYLSVYSKTYLTGNFKYNLFSKKKYNKRKKVLVYLPTYGTCSSIDLIGNYLSNLKDDYYIIAKIHHGTSFLKDEEKRIDIVKNNVDEFYDLHKDLSELLSIADVVLTDNSGSIFEALYTNTPVAVFSNDINQNKWGSFNTTQYELYKEGILPYTNKLEDIKKILKEAQSSKVKKLQREWNNEYLYHPVNQVEDFVNIVENYMNDNIDKRYYDFHNEFRNIYFKLVDNNKNNEDLILNKEKLIENLNENLNSKNNEISEYKKMIDNYQQENTYLKESLNYYQTGKLYKIVNWLYRVKNGGK